MSKILHKEEDSQEYLGIAEPARMPGIAWIVFFIISVSSNITISARLGMNV